MRWYTAVCVWSFLFAGSQCAWANYLADGQFSAGKGSYPDAATSPWYTLHENGDWSVEMDVGRSYDASTQSVKINHWRGGVNIIQDLEGKIEAGHDYIFSLQMMTDNPSTNVAHTASPGVWATMGTSADPNGPYVYRKQFFWETTTVEHGKWERLSGVITAADIADYVGEFIQIRIVKPSEYTTHAIWIDEVQLTSQHDGPEEPATCGLLLD